MRIHVEGLEDVLTHEVAVGLKWKVSDVWRWKAPAHINALETASTMRLFRKLAREGGDLRFSYLCDSHVSRSIVAKGRSGSHSLQQMMKVAAAIGLAYGLYPAGRFCPTRHNPADFPTRDRDLPSVLGSFLDQVDSLEVLWALSSLPRIKKWSANWIRLALLLVPSAASHLPSRGFFRRYALSAISTREWMMDFDSTLGYPGEGPSYCLCCLLGCFGLC